MQRLLAAIHGNPEAMDTFVGVYTWSIPAPSRLPSSSTRGLINLSSQQSLGIILNVNLVSWWPDIFAMRKL
jgi:hypothetical protein